MKLLSTPTRRIVAISFFCMLAFQATYFVGVIGCATYTLGADAAGVSALVFLLNVVLVAGNLASGPLIDSAGPRRTLLAVCAATSVLGLAVWLAPVSYPGLVAAAMALGFSFGMSTTAIDAYPRYFSEDAGELARMNSLNQVATGASVVVGPALAGWVTTWAPVQCVFAILALAPLPAVALVWATREELTAARGEGAGCGAGAPGAGGEAPTQDAVPGLFVEGDATPAPDGRAGVRGFLSDAAEGVRLVFGRSELRVLFFIGFLGFFVYGAFDSLESLFYRDVLRVGADWMGWLSAASGVGVVVGSLLVLRIPKQRLSTRLLAAILALVGVGSMIYTGTPIVAVAAVGQVICGIGFGALAPVRTTLTQQRCEPGNVGRVSSVMRMGMNSAGTLPLLVSPALAAAFGPQAVLFGASTLAALIGLAFALRGDE
ncbi:MFS transporter [Paratractidigestivibacter sp.]|uniref:MFS transporter n=1 Tax=Paratractidigestivibacter sp. TaxID=2847316 RepID=UPI004027DFC1